MKKVHFDKQVYKFHKQGFFYYLNHKRRQMTVGDDRIWLIMRNNVSVKIFLILHNKVEPGIRYLFGAEKGEMQAESIER
jgi:hypothetical protein